MLFRVPAVAKTENEFKTYNMRNKNIFYDINIRGDDPEEVRSFVAELMGDMNYDPSVNELVEFEDAELDSVLRGGRLKPIKALIKGKKSVVRGSKYSLFWKFFAFLGLASALLYFAESSLNLELTNKNSLLMASAILLVTSIIIRSVKERSELELWVKIVGLYNVKDEESDVKIVISAGAKKGDENVISKLKDEISELYNIISKKYVKRKPADVEKMIITKKSESADSALMTAIHDIQRSLNNLDTRLANGDIKEDTYKELKENLEHKKEKLETLFDLVS